MGNDGKVTFSKLPTIPHHLLASSNFSDGIYALRILTLTSISERKVVRGGDEISSFKKKNCICIAK